MEIKNIILSSPQGPVIEVCGGDLMDGTPIYDIKPYLPTADLIPHAKGGFADPLANHALEVSDPGNLLGQISDSDACLIRGVLAEDPRPAYQKDPDRIYSFECGGYHISFRVEENRLILCDLKRIAQ